MDLELAGRRALVTGGSRGLGFATALRLAREGCRMAVQARGEADLAIAKAALAAAGSAGEPLAVAADFTNGEALAHGVAEVLAAFGGLDILVVNTGHLPYGGIGELSDADWRDGFDLVLMSAVRLVRLALPALVESRGSIVFISSASAKEPKPHHLLSNVFRAGVAGLAKTLARSLVGQGVRVNSVAPGLFASGRIKARLEAAKAEPDALFGPQPMGRIGDPVELADAVAFLVSPRAGYITGTTLPLDGGSGLSLF